MSARRPVWLWAFVLWVLALAILSTWRGVALWRERALLVELGSSLSPATLALFVSLDVLCGLAMLAAAVGLWWRREWARQMARIALPAYWVIVQAYVWLALRAGLMRERRWVLLVGAVLAAALSIAALTWHRSRQWLGLASGGHKT